MICTVYVHTSDFSKQDVIVNPSKFEMAEVGALVSIEPVHEATQPGLDANRMGVGGGAGGTASEGIVLQIETLEDVLRGQACISILSSIAQYTGLTARQKVRVSFVESDDVAVDFVDLSLCGSSASRSELWILRETLLHKCICTGRQISSLGLNVQVTALLKDHVSVYSGTVTSKTQVIFRSRCCRLDWLVQISEEMWEFSEDGYCYFEKMLAMMRKTLELWTQMQVRHSLRVIFFSRTIMLPAQASTSTSTDGATADSGRGSASTSSFARNGGSEEDSAAFYDFFEPLPTVEGNYMDLPAVIKRKLFDIRAKIQSFPNARQATKKAEDGDRRSTGSGSQISAKGGRVRKAGAAKTKNRRIRITRAADGNLLEAINLSLNCTENLVNSVGSGLKHTGNSIVVFTAGAPVFNVSKEAVTITHRRIVDMGIGCEMLSLAPAPPHAVPLFRVRAHQATAASSSKWWRDGGVMGDRYSGEYSYAVPHWMHISFFDSYWLSTTTARPYEPRFVIGAAPKKSAWHSGQRTASSLSVNGSSENEPVGLVDRKGDSLFFNAALASLPRMDDIIGSVLQLQDFTRREYQLAMAEQSHANKRRQLRNSIDYTTKHGRDQDESNKPSGHNQSANPGRDGMGALPTLAPTPRTADSIVSSGAEVSIAHKPTPATTSSKSASPTSPALSRPKMPASASTPNLDAGTRHLADPLLKQQKQQTVNAMTKFGPHTQVSRQHEDIAQASVSGATVRGFSFGGGRTQLVILPAGPNPDGTPLAPGAVTGVPRATMVAERHEQEMQRQKRIQEMREQALASRRIADLKLSLHARERTGGEALAVVQGTSSVVPGAIDGNFIWQQAPGLDHETTLTANGPGNLVQQRGKHDAYELALFRGDWNSFNTAAVSEVQGVAGSMVGRNNSSSSDVDSAGIDPLNVDSSPDMNSVLQSLTQKYSSGVHDARAGTSAPIGIRSGPDRRRQDFFNSTEPFTSSLVAMGSSVGPSGAGMMAAVREGLGRSLAGSISTHLNHLGGGAGLGTNSIDAGRSGASHMPRPPVNGAGMHRTTSTSSLYGSSLSSSLTLGAGGGGMSSWAASGRRPGDSTNPPNLVAQSATGTSSSDLGIAAATAAAGSAGVLADGDSVGANLARLGMVSAKTKMSSTLQSQAAATQGVTINPFRPMTFATRFLTSIRLRWSHLYPYGQLETDPSSNKWKALLEPAVLPLTSPDNRNEASKERRYKGYARNFYAVRIPDFMLSTDGRRLHRDAPSNDTGFSGHIHDWLRILNELCFQRLQQNYQIQVVNEGSTSNESACTSGRHPRTQSEINTASFDRVVSEEGSTLPGAQVPPSTTVALKKKDMPRTPGGSAKPVLSFRERRRLREQAAASKVKSYLLKSPTTEAKLRQASNGSESNIATIRNTESVYSSPNKAEKSMRTNQRVAAANATAIGASASAVAVGSLELQLQRNPEIMGDLQNAIAMGMPVTLPIDMGSSDYISPAVVLASKPLAFGITEIDALAGTKGQTHTDASDSNLQSSATPLQVPLVSPRLSASSTRRLVPAAGKEYQRHRRNLEALGQQRPEQIREQLAAAAIAAKHLRFTLTTGHSVHELSFSPAEQNVDVKEYTLRLPGSRKQPFTMTYRYGLWSETKQDYDRCTATFRETPALEPSWNHVDELACAVEYDFDARPINYQRFHFIVIPFFGKSVARRSHSAEATTPVKSDLSGNMFDPHKDLTGSDDSHATDARPDYHWDTLEKVKEVLGSMLSSETQSSSRHHSRDAFRRKPTTASLAVVAESGEAEGSQDQTNGPSFANLSPSSANTIMSATSASSDSTGLAAFASPRVSDTSIASPSSSTSSGPSLATTRPETTTALSSPDVVGKNSRMSTGRDSTTGKDTHGTSTDLVFTVLHTHHTSGRLHFKIRTTSKLSFFRFEWVNLVIDKLSDLEKPRVSAQSPPTSTTRKCLHIELQWLACSAEGVLGFVDKMARVVRTAHDGPLKQDGTPDMRSKVNRNKYLPPGRNKDGTPDKRLNATRGHSLAGGALKRDGTPDMRSKVHRNKYLPPGRNKDGTPDMRLKATRGHSLAGGAFDEATTQLDQEGVADAAATPRSRKADATGSERDSNDPFGTEITRCALLVKFPGFLREPVAKFCDPWQVFVKHDIFRKSGNENSDPTRFERWLRAKFSLVLDHERSVRHWEDRSVYQPYRQYVNCTGAVFVRLVLHDQSAPAERAVPKREQSWSSFGIAARQSSPRSPSQEKWATRMVYIFENEFATETSTKERAVLVAEISEFCKGFR